MADSTLAAIRTKVRRLTRSPSTSQITEAEIDEYVNTFIQYDFPEQLRIFTNRKNFSFFTQPNTDTYGDTYLDPNIYINIEEPIFVAGRRVYLTQSQAEFYSLYPKNASIVDTQLRGDGISTNFGGTLTPTPILPNQVSFTTTTAGGTIGLVLEDNGSGLLTGNGTGAIDYISGSYTLIFSIAPDNGAPIIRQTVPYTAAIPQMVLYFDNTLVFRPVPDQSYKVELEVYQRPTELLAAGTSPELEQWWQYIAYGAAKKIFEDRTDEEGVRMIMPEFKQQQQLVLRRTIVQQTKERVATIYTENVDTSRGAWWWNNT